MSNRVDLLTAALTEIARLREERRWIPVAQRPPENIQIIATDGEAVSATSYYKGYGFESINGDKLWFTPTHWQPLPAPPGGEVE